MKIVANFSEKPIVSWFKISIVVLLTFLLLISPSCQKDDGHFLGKYTLNDDDFLANTMVQCKSSVLYFGHKKFVRSYGAPYNTKQIIENQYFSCYDGNFVLKIMNGHNKKTRVSSAEIRIDGELVVGPSDFSRNASFITKVLTGLNSKSVLEVKLYGSPGSYIDLWIEGTIKMITPTFEQIGPILTNSAAPDLPLTSTNGISGIWNPSTINTSLPGTYTYTFTPNDNHCANTASMIITIEGVVDMDGNQYETVKIGDQWWMSENLKTTRYNNGDLIGTTNPATLDISSESDPKYQWPYNGDETNAASYGRLYTWHTVNDNRGLCPAGWHIPEISEWVTLTDFLINNGYGYEGSGTDIAKSLVAISGWHFDSTPGTAGYDPSTSNSSGFTALAGGVRIQAGIFTSMGEYATFWSSTESNSEYAWGRALLYNINFVTGGEGLKRNGASIRCVKD